MNDKQRTGIERAKAEGKYKGKQQSDKTIKACKAAVADIDKGLSKEKAAKANGIGVATLYRFIKTEISNHGGKRKGAGRKKERPTVLIRVDTELSDMFKQMNQIYRVTKNK